MTKPAMATEDTLEKLREALEARDAKVAECPIQKGFQDVCPRCKATSSMMCGVVAMADYGLVEDVRASLKMESR